MALALLVAAGRWCWTLHRCAHPSAVHGDLIPLVDVFPRMGDTNVAAAAVAAGGSAAAPAAPPAVPAPAVLPPRPGVGERGRLRAMTRSMRFY